MPYPYGMYGSPAVGNGLGGLPRRASVTTSTTRQYPLKLQAVGNAITYTAAATPTLTSQPIPTGKGTGAILFNATTTAPYGAPKGFAYDVNAGMLGWATNGTAGVAGNALTTATAFANGMMYFDSNGTAGAIYVANTNGTSTTVSTLTTIPSSGTLSNGNSYSGLTVVTAMGSTLYYPRCFDAYGNMVVLYRATVSAASWLCAFVINAAGTIVNSQNLFALNSSGASFPTSDFWVVRSGTGFIVGAIYRDATNSCMNMWNVNADFTSATAIGPSSTWTPASGAAPVNGTFNSSSTTVAISAYDSNGTAKVWGATLDTNGAAVAHTSTNTVRDVAVYQPLHQYNNPQFFDPANGIYYLQGSSVTLFPTSDTTPTSFSMGLAFNTGTAISDSNMGIVLQQLIAATSTDSEANGVSAAQLGYLGNGYWALVWSVQTVFQLKAKLFKEV